MSIPAGTSANDEIARVAYAIWEAEGRPEGRDHEHWMRARQLVEEGRADAEYPQAAAGEAVAGTPRPVQPGFEDAAPGTVPVMKEEPGEELREEPGGRFAKQLASLPDEATADAPGKSATPGPRNPAPVQPGNAAGYVAVASVEDLTGRALSDASLPPSAPTRKPRRATGAATGLDAE